MLQLFYCLAFGAIAFLAIRNVVTNVITLGQAESKPKRRPRQIPHPELLDDQGNLTNEPLLVIRSANLEDTRNRLDELFQESSDGEHED